MGVVPLMVRMTIDTSYSRAPNRRYKCAEGIMEHKGRYLAHQRGRRCHMKGFQETERPEPSLKAPALNPDSTVCSPERLRDPDGNMLLALRHCDLIGLKCALLSDTSQMPGKPNEQLKKKIHP